MAYGTGSNLACSAGLPKGPNGGNVRESVSTKVRESPPLLSDCVLETALGKDDLRQKTLQI